MEKKEDKKSYQVMIEEAIRADASRTGTSKQIIVKYLVENFSVDAEKSKHYIKGALKKGLGTGHFKMAKESGKGANSYKLGEVATKAKKPKESKSPKKTESAKAPKKKSVKSPLKRLGMLSERRLLLKLQQKRRLLLNLLLLPRKQRLQYQKLRKLASLRKHQQRRSVKLLLPRQPKLKSNVEMLFFLSNLL